MAKKRIGLNQYSPLLKRLILLVTAPLVVIFLLSALCSFAPLSNIIVAPMVLTMIVVWLLALLIVSAKAAWRGVWDVSVMALIVVWLCSLLAVPIWRWSGDYAHLFVMYPFYSERIKATHEAPTSFYWGSRSFYGLYLTDYYLVYDPAGDALSEAQSRDFADHHIQTNMRHMIGDFYLLTRTRN